MQSELVQTFEQKQINSLPNEMLRTLLANLEVQKLIAIRAVCKRWLVVIEDICRENRSIVILANNGLGSISNVSERFNGLVDFSKNCALFDVKSKKYNQISLSTDSCVLLTRLFPRVENLVLDASVDRTSGTAKNLLFLLKHWSSIVTLLLPSSYYLTEPNRVALSDTIDNLTALKRFHFPTIDLIKQTTFARLHHCFFSMVNVAKVLPLLGTNCTSLHLNGWVPLSDITPVLQLNAPLVKGLTHLRILRQSKEVLSFICSNFVALKMLDIHFADRQILDADLISYLGRLSNLRQLSIHWLTIDLPTIRACQASLTTLNSVQSLTITRFEFRNAIHQFTGDLFCLVLSTIFPNLVQFTVQHNNQLVRDGISRNLDSFVHLRKHVIAQYCN